MIYSIECAGDKPLGNTNLDKLKKVILSCETKEQLQVAIRYYTLSLKLHELSYNDMLDINLYIGYVICRINCK